MTLHHTVDTQPMACTIRDTWDEARDIRTFVFESDMTVAPGQFVMLWLPGVNEKPFSVARAENGELWCTICRVGEFTTKLFELEKGDKVGIRGPYGQGFAVQSNKKVVLIGGGYGSAPLHFTGTSHQKAGSEVTFIIGARSKDLLIWEQASMDAGFRTIITTNDGSHGVQGFTTDALAQLLEEETIDMVQTCGPEKMMRAIAQMCVQKKIPCEVSVERYMKCGFGVCGQCVTESGEKMCQTGPVVPGSKALTYPDFGAFHRGPEGQKVMW